MIKKFIYRILKLLLRIGVIDKIWEINYTGKILSLNDLYRQGHWAIRANLKNKYKEIFSELIKKANVEWSDKFFVIIFFNTRHDTDNLVGVAKILVDTLKGDLIPEDNKAHYKGLCIFPDEGLEKSSLEILIIRHG